ncbi:hypothetical protein LQV05_001363 [Cryptococcus neoformans]|nr:hypothetical protein LQV05_001363 [Cryptococcus neoformans]
MIADSSIPSESGCTPSSFPFYGPLFSSPSLKKLQFRGKSIPVNPSSFLFSSNAQRPTARRLSNIRDGNLFGAFTGWIITSKSSAFNIFTQSIEVYSSSVNTYWEECMPWEQGLLPHFPAETAVTRYFVMYGRSLARSIFYHSGANFPHTGLITAVNATMKGNPPPLSRSTSTYQVWTPACHDA